MFEVEKVASNFTSALFLLVFETLLPSSCAPVLTPFVLYQRTGVYTVLVQISMTASHSLKMPIPYWVFLSPDRYKGKAVVRPSFVLVPLASTYSPQPSGWGNAHSNTEAREAGGQRKGALPKDLALVNSREAAGSRRKAVDGIQ